MSVQLNTWFIIALAVLAAGFVAMFIEDDIIRVLLSAGLLMTAFVMLMGTLLILDKLTVKQKRVKL